MEIPSNIKRNLVKAIKKFGTDRNSRMKVLPCRNINLILLCNQFLLASKDCIHLKPILDLITLPDIEDFLNYLHIDRKPYEGIWEGWKVSDFIRVLEPLLYDVQKGNTIYKKITNYNDLKQWCMDNQPYYKGFIPEVVDYFANKYNVGYK